MTVTAAETKLATETVVISVGDRVHLKSTFGSSDSQGMVGEVVRIIDNGVDVRDRDGRVHSLIYPWSDRTITVLPESEHEQGPEAFEEIVHALYAEAADLLLRKHRDYGPGNIAGSPGGPLNGLRVRLYDKLARLNNLLDQDREPEFETLVDTLMDIGNYGLIGVLVERGDWPTLEKR